MEKKEAIIFDGRAFAKKKEEILTKKVVELKERGIKPHLAVILTSKDPASKLYVNLKKKVAERIGIEVEVYSAVTNTRDYKYVLNLLAVLNTDPLVHGIMIQLPLGDRYKPYKEKILGAINPAKDVDGLNPNGNFTPATVKAVVEIIREAQKHVPMIKNPSAFVVGSEGVVGSGLIKKLTELGFPTRGYDAKHARGYRSLWGVPPFMTLKADILITATGVANILQARHVNNNAVVIDVGSPEPDFNIDATTKASFFTPVPGGVGPVTIVSLLENLVEAAYNTV